MALATQSEPNTQALRLMVAVFFGKEGGGVGANKGIANMLASEAIRKWDDVVTFYK